MTLKNLVKDKIPLTLGEVIDLAEQFSVGVTEVILTEVEIQSGKARSDVREAIDEQFKHNYEALDIGLSSGESILLGKAGQELQGAGRELVADSFLNRVLVYTLAAQVGNHSIGLRPCAGTGDSCPYTAMLRAMLEEGYSQDKVTEMGALLLKIGSMFRAGKTTTGCNMEGFGAGAAAMAAAFTELKGGTPRQMEQAMVLAISPSIGNPCTPRVMVPGLCATHIGGAVLIGNLAAGLAIQTSIEVNVPIDVMLAMAASVHPISAKALVPEVSRYMEPFFKRKNAVEELIEQDVRDKENKQKKETIIEAEKAAKELARQARPITDTLGEAVVGGSSQAVGSPTNAARIAHYLKKGEIKKVIIELYPELFARRGINLPGILMGAVFGSSTSDYRSYDQAVEKVRNLGIEVEIKETQEHQVQRITIETDQVSSQVDSLNRGGGRLVLRNAIPDYDQAVKIAEDLGLVLAEDNR